MVPDGGDDGRKGLGGTGGRSDGGGGGGGTSGGGALRGDMLPLPDAGTVPPWDASMSSALTPSMMGLLINDLVMLATVDSCPTPPVPEACVCVPDGLDVLDVLDVLLAVVVAGTSRGDVGSCRRDGLDPTGRSVLAPLGPVSFDRDCGGVVVGGSGRLSSCGTRVAGLGWPLPKLISVGERLPRSGRRSELDFLVAIFLSDISSTR